MSKTSGLANKVGKSFSKGLGEYFLGINTWKSYNYERRFYREYLIDEPKILKTLLRNSKISQGINLISDKVIPNLFDAGIIAYSVYTKIPKIYIY